jgi:hypothetical protein
VIKTEKRDVAEAANWRWQDRIDIDPKIQAGKPVIKGTRVPSMCSLAVWQAVILFVKSARATW